jgi:aminoglycoside phosphotransferase (APT) family kinase protein
VTGSVVRGIDERRVAGWFASNVPGCELPLRFELIAGGRSNLTYRVTDAAGHAFALRRPPLSHVLPTAHDMGREHRIISALGPTDVPVPPAIAYCGDEEVNGAPFYVMGYVEGHVLRDAEAASSVLDEAARRRAGESLVEVLVAIHDVDVDAVGLGGLSRRDAYIERQLRRWYRQVEQSYEITGRSVGAVAQVHDQLAARMPPQRYTGIVHGDYRLDNTILGGDGSVRAVLDWEICTLGDPLTDLGLLMVYWAERGERAALGLSPTTVAGFPARAEMVARYVERSGRDVSSLPYYVAFGYWKLACILEGVFARYTKGAGGGDPSDAAGLGEQVAALAEMARDALRSAP